MPMHCYNLEADLPAWDALLYAHADYMTQSMTPFIDRELKELEIYDARRPEGHSYAFPIHVRRVRALVAKFAQRLGFSTESAKILGDLCLIHDCGKRFQPIGIWDTVEKPDKMLKDIRREHTIIGSNHILVSLDENNPIVRTAASLARYHHEAADGSGYMGLRLEALNLPVRMLILADSFDGWRTKRPHFGDRDISPEGVLARMTGEKSKDFDPALLAAFARMVQNTDE